MNRKITLEQLQNILAEDEMPTGAAAADMFAKSFKDQEEFRKLAGNLDYMKQLGQDEEFTKRLGELSNDPNSEFNKDIYSRFTSSREDAEMMGKLGMGPAGGIRIDKDGTRHIRRYDPDGTYSDVAVQWSTPKTTPNTGSSATSPTISKEHLNEGNTTMNRKITLEELRSVLENDSPNCLPPQL